MENNQSEKTGKFICKMRKLQNLTQKELAQKLGVTDKAVSKWERGLSCPDISLLIPLAEILGVTTGELLNGEEKTGFPEKLEEDIVKETIQYSSRSTGFKVEEVKKSILTILTVSSIIAIAICLICDFCITNSFTWSLIVTISLIFSWLILLPFFQAKKNIIKKSLIVLSITIIPYLAILGQLLNVSELFRLGVLISIISIIGLWCIYGVFLKLNNRKLCAAGIFFLIAISINVGINYIIVQFTQQRINFAQTIIQIICSITLLIVAIICFGIDHIVIQEKNKEIG